MAVVMRVQALLENDVFACKSQKRHDQPKVLFVFFH